MKKFVFNLVLLSLVSCSKHESNLGITNDPSVDQTAVVAKGLRTNGEVLYYSVDEELNIVYKMKLKTLADGTIEVKRGISNGNHNGQQIVVVNHISEGLEYNTIDEYTIEINASKDLNTYLIPFNSADSIQNFLSGGGDKWLASCKCPAGAGSNATCQAELTKSTNGTLTASCKGKNCQDCKLKMTKVKASAKREFNYPGGFIILTANEIVEI